MQWCFNPADWQQPFSLAAPLAVESTETLTVLGQQLLQQSSPTLKALGFWLRPANLQAMAHTLPPHGHWRPRGQVLQIAPANVDLLFIYVALLALWMGNHCWVRLASQQGEDEAVLITLLEQLSQQPEHQSCLTRLHLFRSEHNEPALQALAAAVDMRVLWGSDASLARLSQWPKSAHCQELLMGHKHSLALLKAEAILQQPAEHWVAAFIRDAFSLQQQACSSPRTLVWVGTKEQVSEAQQHFWQAISPAVPAWSEAALLERELACQRLALEGLLEADAAAGPQLGWQRCRVQCLSDAQQQLHPGLGLFYELSLQQLDELANQLAPVHQSATFFGWQREELVNWAVNHRVMGLDRIEPMGEALRFHPIWDGEALLPRLGRLLRA